MSEEIVLKEWAMRGALLVAEERERARDPEAAADQRQPAPRGIPEYYEGSGMKALIEFVVECYDPELMAGLTEISNFFRRPDAPAIRQES